jgi:hypothetical protein
VTDVARVKVRNLFEEADVGALGATNIATVGSEDSGDDLQQGGLARTIDTDDADSVTRGDGEREALENRSLGTLQGDILKIDQDGHVPSRLVTRRLSSIPAMMRVVLAGEEDA